MRLQLLNKPKSSRLRLLDKEEKSKKPKLFDLLTDATIATEGLIKGQTPLRDERLSAGGRKTSRFKDTVQGYPIDWGAWSAAPSNRKNFYYVSEEDTPKVINQQYKNYIKNPTGYGLTSESPLEDVIKTFDRERPQNKINYLKKLGIDVKTKIKDLAGSFDLSKINPFSVATAEAAETEGPRLRLLNRETSNIAVRGPIGGDTELWEDRQEQQYRRQLTDKDKARSVVELSYRQKGEEVPGKLKALWMIEDVKPVVESMLLPHWSLLKGMRGIVGAEEPKTTFWRTFLSSAKKGILSPEEVKPISVSAMKAYPNMPWQTAGLIGTITEFETLTLGAGTKFISSLSKARTAADLNPIVDKVYMHKARQLVKEGRVSTDRAGSPEFQEVAKRYIRDGLTKLKGADKEVLTEAIRVGRAMRAGTKTTFLAGLPVPQDMIKQFKLTPAQAKDLAQGVIKGIPQAAVAAYQGLAKPPMEPLIEEAKKFKTAEKFVESQIVTTKGLKHLPLDQYNNFTEFMRDVEKLNDIPKVTTIEITKQVDKAIEIWGDRGSKDVVDEISIKDIKLAEVPLTKKPTTTRDISEPIQVLQTEEGFTLIDGRHRLDQAIANKQTTVKAIVKEKSTVKQLTDIWKQAQQPKAGGMIHDLSPKEKEQLKGLKPDSFKLVTLDRDVEVKLGDKTKKYKKDENIYIYQDNRTGKAIVKDGDYGILPKKEVTKVEQAGTPIKAPSPEEEGIEEVWKGEELEPGQLPSGWSVKQEQGEWVVRNADGFALEGATTEQGAINRSLERTTTPKGDIKFGPDTHPTMSLPGGENYRELLLKAPSGDAGEIGTRGGLQIGDAREFDKPVFRSSHFDEPNVLAHIRMNDRTVDGKKILFVEEIQSDWAKAGREKGFNVEPTFPENDLYVKKDDDGLWYIYNKHTNQIITGQGKGADSKEIALENWKKWPSSQGGAGVPYHPLLKNWHELAMKKVLDVAVREGYDGISWVTGEQTAERYDLSKQVDRITFNKEAPALEKGKVYIAAHKDDVNLTRGDYTREEAEKTFGKEITKKIFEGKPSLGTLKDQDLKIGGEWAKNLYDRMIPQALKKLTKGEVGKIDLGLKGQNYLNMDVAEQRFLEGKTVMKVWEDGTNSEVIDINEIQTATSGEKFYVEGREGLPDGEGKPAEQQQPFLELTPQIKERIIGQPKAGGLPTGARTLTGVIKEGGGIDFSKDYNVKEMEQFGLKNTPGARTPDDWAKTLQSQGLLPVPENMNPGDYLMEQLKVKKLRLIAPKGEKAAQKEFFEAQREAIVEEKVKGLEFDVERYDKEIQAELVKQINAVQKKAGKPSVLRTNDVKRIVRQETGQNKVRDLIAIPEAKALESQLEREAYTAKIAYKEGIEKGIVLSQEDINKIEALLAKEQFRTAEERLAAEMSYKADIVREKRFGKEKLNKFKAHQLEVAMRKRARITARTKIKSMIADIKGIDTSKMRPEFAAPVKELKESMDFTKRTEKTLTKLAMTTKFLAENPEADIPQYVLDKVELVQRKNISDITLEEFEALHNTIMHYAHLNKLKNTIIREQRERRIQDVIVDAKVRMKPRKEVDLKNIEDSDKSTASKFGEKLIETLGIRSEHLDLVVETLFGGTDSEAYKLLFDDINEGQRKALTYVHESEELVSGGLEKNDFKRHGIKDINKWLREKIEIRLTGGKRFAVSRGKKLSILKHYANDKNFAAILDGGITFKDAPTIAYNITPEDFKIIVDSATAPELDFIDPTGELFEIQHGKINEVHIKTKGYALPKEENYFPLERGLLGKKFLEEQDILEQFKNKFVRIGLWKGMLKSRVKSKLPVVLKDIDEVVAQSVFNSSAYIGLEEPLSNASKLLYSPEFRSEIENRYGRSTWKYIDKAMRDIAGEHKSYTSVEDMLLSAKNKVTPALLGLNPFVMAKQIVSFFLYNIYVDAPSLTQGFIDFKVHRSAILERHKKYSPHFREREKTGYARDVADVLKKGAERRFTGNRQTIQQKSLGGIKFFDREAVAPGMEGCVIQKLKELKGNTGMTPEQKMVEAYKWADRVTSITQPMFDPQFRSDISRGTTTEKLWTYFSTQLNQFLNILRRTWRHGQRTGDYNPFAHALFLVVVVNGSSMYMIDRARDKIYRRAKEASVGEWLLAILTNSASMFYFVREAAGSIQNKLKYGTFRGRDISNPILSVMDLAIDTVVKGIEMFTKDKKEKRKKSASRFIDGAIQLFFTSRGLPYYTPRRLIRSLIGAEEDQKKKKGKKKSRLRLL